MIHPNAINYQHDPARLRALLKVCDLTQAAAADAIGIAPRTMRQYLDLSGRFPAPYSVYFCILVLAEIRKKEARELLRISLDGLAGPAWPAPHRENA